MNAMTMISDTPNRIFCGALMNAVVIFVLNSVAAGSTLPAGAGHS